MNKYKVYVDCKELTEYYEKYGLDFDDPYDFELLGISGVNYLESGVECIGGFVAESNAIQVGFKKVDLHTFITEVLEEEWRAGDTNIPAKLKVEDVHYVDVFYNEDFLELKEDSEGVISICSTEEGYKTNIYLSSESLIQLGQDLIRIGVQQQTKEDKDED